MWIMQAALADAGQRTGPRKREAGGDPNDTRITLTSVADGNVQTGNAEQTKNFGDNDLNLYSADVIGAGDLQQV